MQINLSPTALSVVHVQHVLLVKVGVQPEVRGSVDVVGPVLRTEAGAQRKHGVVEPEIQRMQIKKLPNCVK